MRIHSISMRNFKGFKNSKLDFAGKSTVIFGVNGVGKSTVLSAVNFCFWTFLNRLNPSQSISYRSFDSSLVHRGASQIELICDVQSEFQSEVRNYRLNRSYIRSKIGKKAKSDYDKKAYNDLHDDFLNFFFSDDKRGLPIFINYGTNRAVLNIPLRIHRKHQFSKLTALEYATENGLDFKTFFEWYRNQEDIENERIRETGNPEYRDKYLECVRYAIEKMLGNVVDLKVKRSPLRMTVKKDGIEIEVNQLSDGEKCTLALFGDLARRLALANPNSENPLEGAGVVLIDEIELHMHPSWQRRVLKVLHGVFPNIQFIVTTHSPQVLGEMGDDFKVFKLNTIKEGDENTVVEQVFTYGKDSNWILRYEMETKQRAEEVLAIFENFYRALDESNFLKAQDILNELQNIIGNDPEITAMQVQLDMEQI